MEDNRDLPGRTLGGHSSRCRSGNDDIDFQPNQFIGKIGEAIEFPLCISVLDGDGLPLNVAKLLKPLPKRCEPKGRYGFVTLAEARRAAKRL